MRVEIEAFERDMAKAVRDAVDRARSDLDFLIFDKASFAKAPENSIDYAVIEQTAPAVVIPANVGWSDIGSWAAVRGAF
jgi:mannose-1-phosphate guanylyltransferase/mannose-6-phosphate isomerase